MKLRKKQIELVIQCVGEGLETGEINKLAAKFKPPFKVTRQQVDYYRKTREVQLTKIKDASETSALKTGLSLKENRVKILHDLADLLCKDLFENNMMWLDQAKGIGSGPTWEKYEYQEFNAAEIAQLRAVLDDIAAEVGERVKKQEITGKDGGPIPFDLDSWKQEREKRLQSIKKLEE